MTTYSGIPTGLAAGLPTNYNGAKTSAIKPAQVDFSTRNLTQNDIVSLWRVAAGDVVKQAYAKVVTPEGNTAKIDIVCLASPSTLIFLDGFETNSAANSIGGSGNLEGFCDATAPYEFYAFSAAASLGIKAMSATTYNTGKINAWLAIDRLPDPPVAT